MEPIAIVGMACRFPGAASLDAYWRLLRDGVDAVREVPADRWDFRRFPDASRWGGFLDRIGDFDPAFFGISPREAAYMDPQQRLLLEVAWEALEDAGLTLEQCAGRPAAVFVGISTYDYGALELSDPERVADGYANTGGALSIAANRISYLFDLRGPSLSLDTACSSSLAAAHLACQSLWSGESDMALAGGVNLILSPAITIGFSRLKAMASDGRCKTFDARADGFVRGEGSGVVVLKTLERARRDGDRIYAVVRGSALNQDGRTNGLTAPNGLSQEALVRRALESAGVAPARIGYVEAHGTGTALGDPIELNALGAALGRDRARPCAVGSVKTNVGHLEAAAGVAGLMKLALALHHGEIPPSLHFREPNPHIPFADLRLEVQRARGRWPDDLRPALGGVSSFGFGGTNVHMVLEEAPAPAPVATERGAGAGAEERADRAYLLPLSAKSPDALAALARAWRDALRSSPAEAASLSGAALGDAAHTASRRRTHHEHRLALAARLHEEVLDQLDAFLAGEARPGLSAGRAAHGRRRKVAFVFPGQGSQWLGMARGLMAREPAFRAALEPCEAAIRAEVGWSLIDALHAEAAPGSVDVIQPALFAVQVGLAALWRAWGVEPDAVVGHSMGEAAAACVAGRLGLEDAAAVICRRSRLLRTVSGKGAMAAIELSIDEAESALAGYEDRVSIAVSNSPSSTVLSGDPAALEEILAKLEARSVFCRRVKVDVASHSPQMDPLRAELLAVLKDVRPRPGRVPLYSTVTGTRDNVEMDAAYWVRNLREPVLFSRATERLLADGHAIFLELSPHPILLASVQQTLRHLGKDGTVLPSLRREEDEQAVMLGSLGALFTLGKPVRWEAANPAGRTVRLPSYPWQRERFWVEQAKPKKERAGSGHALLGAHVRSAVDGTHFWDVELDAEAVPWLAEHRLEGAAVLPAAAYLELALAAARDAFGAGSHAVENVEFKRALLLPERGTARAQVVVKAPSGGVASFEVFGVSASSATPGLPAVLHAAGTLRLAAANGHAAAAAPISPPEVQARCAATVTSSDYYDQARKRGVDFGPAFRIVQQAWRRDGEAIARLNPPPQVLADAGAYRMHPVLLDACFQTLAAALPAPQGRKELFVSAGVDSLRVEADLDSRPVRWSRAVLQERSGDGVLRGDVSLLDESGHPLVTGVGLRLQPLAETALLPRPARDEWFHELLWQSASPPRPASSRRRAAARWILLADERGVGQALRSRLEAGGDGCLVVSRAEEYAFSESECRLDPGRPEHFRQLLRDALGGRVPCRGIAHLWSLDGVREDEPSLASLQRLRDRECASLLHLVQALAVLGRRERPRLWLVTRGAQSVEPGREAAAIAPSPLAGLARTVAHEHPELGCASVDLSANPSTDEVEALRAEMCADDREDQIALRGSARYVARLARLHPPAAATAAGFVAEATYLLAGELTGAGLAAAQWMAGAGARNVMLLGSDVAAEAGEAVTAMQKAGARVAVVRADPADARQVADALSTIDARLPLRGVIYAPAAPDDGILLQTDAARLLPAIASRADAAWNLHTLTAGQPLDFFVLFSSSSAVVGAPGRGSDAAAGAFLDALAHHRRFRGRPALSIDRGRSSPRPRVDSPDAGGRVATSGMEDLSPAQTVAALGRLWASPAAQAGVMSVDWTEWRRAHRGAADSPLLALFDAEEDSATAAPAARLTGAMLRAVAPGERQGVLEAHLRADVARVLGLAVAKLDVNQPLNTMGIDSLMAVELKNQVEMDLQVSVPLIKVIQGPSVAEMAALLLSLLAGVDASVTDVVERPRPPAPDDSLLGSLLSLRRDERNG